MITLSTKGMNRLQASRFAYRNARSFGLDVFSALYRATRMLLTGRTGPYKIRWRKP